MKHLIYLSLLFTSLTLHANNNYTAIAKAYSNGKEVASMVCHIKMTESIGGYILHITYSGGSGETVQYGTFSKTPNSFGYYEASNGHGKLKVSSILSPKNIVNYEVNSFTLTFVANGIITEFIVK